MTETQAERVQIAETILQQLGGNRFRIMTGARGFLALESGLRFRLPGGGGFTRDGINCVSVILDWTDTYIVKFERVRGMKSEVVKEIPGVYCDQLPEIFEDVTGLRVSL